MNLRPSGRRPDELRRIAITRNYTKHAEGSVLIEFGDTRVLCTASVEERVPGFLKGRGQGWLTAEYGMLPRATNTRTDREAARGKQSGRRAHNCQDQGIFSRSCAIFVTTEGFQKLNHGIYPYVSGTAKCAEFKTGLRSKLFAVTPITVGQYGFGATPVV